jgi:hypothetical protein
MQSNPNQPHDIIIPSKEGQTTGQGVLQQQQVQPLNSALNNPQTPLPATSYQLPATHSPQRQQADQALSKLTNNKQNKSIKKKPHNKQNKIKRTHNRNSQNYPKSHQNNSERRNPWIVVEEK